MRIETFADEETGRQVLGDEIVLEMKEGQEYGEIGGEQEKEQNKQGFSCEKGGLFCHGLSSYSFR